MGNGGVCLAKTPVEPARLLRVSGLIAAAFSWCSAFQLTLKTRPVTLDCRRVNFCGE